MNPEAPDIVDAKPFTQEFPDYPFVHFVDFSGGQQRDSILADAMEGIIGAVHEDGGIEAARAMLERLFEQRLRDVGAHKIKDPKTELQELLQAESLPLPAYAIVGTEGLDARLAQVRALGGPRYYG